MNNLNSQVPGALCRYDLPLPARLATCASRFTMVSMAASLMLMLGAVSICRAETSLAMKQDPAAVEPNIQPVTLPPVAVAPGDHHGVSRGRTVRAVFRAIETASISTELTEKIIYLPEREGDRFRKGDLIVGFDCRKIIAEHDASVAAYNSNRAAHEAQLQMLRYNAAGELSVDQSKFEMQKAEAEARGLEVRRSGCSIYAPFAGRVVEKAAKMYEIPQPNQPLIKIINDSHLELILMVPSSWLSDISGGTIFKVKIDENGETHDARVIQSTGVIDPVSQSARLIAELVEPSATVMPGMSGSAEFTRKEAHQ